MEVANLNQAFSIIVLIFVLFNFSTNAAFNSTEEARALLKWKSSLQNQNASDPLRSWTLFPVNDTNISSHQQTKISPCAWFGIHCNRAGSVISINLSSSSLKGTLHDFPFSLFPQLEYFELSFNEFFGIIPPQIGNLSKLKYFDLQANKLSGKIPLEIGLLTHLKFLHLSLNHLSGSIPEEVGQLGSLHELDLGYNHLDGSIPNSLGNVSNLEKLSFYDNKLSGSIPRAIGNLKSLSDLSLSKNQLSGFIPHPIGNLSNLKFLWLYSNNLSGSIPKEIGYLNSLSIIEIGNNQLNGSIPHSLGNLSNCKILYFYHNCLYGFIPKEIGNMKSLSELDLSGNQLNGYVPPSTANLSNLEHLELFDNMLSGPILQDIGNLKLITLHLENNKFSGNLPQNICQSGTLEKFVVSGNHFLGPIPKSLRNCRSLVRARLQQNQLTGNIFEDFGKYPHLNFLDLSQNRFYGEISLSTFGKCQQLGTLNVTQNYITGILPHEIGNLSQLHVLDLSSNHLVGEIPVELGKLTFLNKLILNGNQLFGGLPLEIGLLTDLEYLDLSSNRLNKSIPESLGNLLKVHYLSLRNNQFSQEIPTQLGKLIQLSELDLSHNLLTGHIPSQICNLESLEKLNLSHNELSGFIPSCFDVMHGLSSIDISYNDLRGPIPNSRAFRNAHIEALTGNKGLCGDHHGLPSCEASKSGKHALGKTWAILFTLLGALTLLILCIGIFFTSQRWKRDTRQQQQRCVNSPSLLSVLNFEGKIMHEEIIRATNDLDTRYCIGKGGYARVYKAELPSGEIVAVKKFHSQYSSEMVDKNEFINEVRALTKIRHRNIVKFYGFCSHARHSFLVYNYLEKGSLNTVLSNDEAAKELDWSKRINVVKGVAHALSYMHHDCLPPLVHRDISSKNVLLDLDYEAHVSDFGTAKFLKQDSYNKSELAGTCGYLAPEFAYTLKITEKCDVYSFGVLALEIIKGNHPRDSLSLLLSSLSSNINISLNDMLDPRLPSPSLEIQGTLISITEVALLCLHASPESRPPMKFFYQQLCK